ncbi:MAG: YggT family protein [Anaerolineales bacterium]|nr:YggT family protein [Anaerolineales bacterium]
MALVQIINLLFNAFYILILARIIFSWIRVSPYHPTWGPIMRFVFQATEPIMEPIRRLIPPTGGLDFSPMIVLILASVLRTLLISTLV